jgi:hypothetical protein
MLTGITTQSPQSAHRQQVSGKLQQQPRRRRERAARAAVDRPEPAVQRAQRVREVRAQARRRGDEPAQEDHQGVLFYFEVGDQGWRGGWGRVGWG